MHRRGSTRAQPQVRGTCHVGAALQKGVCFGGAALKARPQLGVQLLVGQGAASVPNYFGVARQEAAAGRLDWSKGGGSAQMFVGQGVASATDEQRVPGQKALRYSVSGSAPTHPPFLEEELQRGVCLFGGQVPRSTCGRVGGQGRGAGSSWLRHNRMHGCSDGEGVETGSARHARKEHRTAAQPWCVLQGACRHAAYPWLTEHHHRQAQLPSHAAVPVVAVRGERGLFSHQLCHRFLPLQRRRHGQRCGKLSGACAAGRRWVACRRTVGVVGASEGQSG